MIHSIHHPKKERYTKFVPHFSGESPLSEHAIIGYKIYHTTTAQGDCWPKLFRLFFPFLSMHVKPNPVKITRYSRCCLEVEKKKTHRHWPMSTLLLLFAFVIHLKLSSFMYNAAINICCMLTCFRPSFKRLHLFPYFFLLHIVFWFYLCQTVDDLFSQICI